MSIKFEELPNWRFDADEISACVYKASGIDNQKRSVEAIGTDPDKLIDQCKQKALAIVKNLQCAQIGKAHSPTEKFSF